MKIAGITIDDHDVPLWAMAASAIALLIALISQYLGDLAPCKLCLWQRIPHGAVILIGTGALLWFRGPRERLLLTWASMVALSIGAGIALYHAGVEQHVRCDEIPWSLFGLSIAAWNALACIVLAAFCSVAGWRQMKGKTE